MFSGRSTVLWLSNLIVLDKIVKLISGVVPDFADTLNKFVLFIFISAFKSFTFL